LLAAKIDAQQVYDTQKALADQMDATVKADQAAIESARVNLNYCTVTSPINGRTGIRLVDQGNIVHANDTNGLVVITQLQPISVVFTLPEQELDLINKEILQTGAQPKVLAVGRDNNDVLDEGTLAVIDNQIDTATGTIRLKANFPNEHNRLWPGQFVNARLLLTTRKDGLVVPTAAIQRGPNGAYVFVIEEGIPPGTGKGGHSGASILVAPQTRRAYRLRKIILQPHGNKTPASTAAWAIQAAARTNRRCMRRFSRSPSLWK